MFSDGILMQRPGFKIANIPKYIIIQIKEYWLTLESLSLILINYILLLSIA